MFETISTRFGVYFFEMKEMRQIINIEPPTLPFGSYLVHGTGFLTFRPLQLNLQLD